MIPVGFVLAFYVAQVVDRFWEQLDALPWTMRLATLLTGSLHGEDDVPRMTRRTVMRYAVLCYTVTMTSIAPSAKKRFPTTQHLVNAGQQAPLNFSRPFNGSVNCSSNWYWYWKSRSTQPSTLRGTVKWVPVKGRWCSAAGKVTCLAESNGSILLGGWLTCGLTACRLNRDQLRAQRSVTSMGSLYLFYWKCVRVCVTLYLRRTHGVLRLLDHVCGTCCQSIYGCVTVLNSLNGCSRPICLVLETAALCDALVRSAVYK